MAHTFIQDCSEDQNLFQLLIEQAPSAIAVFDREMRYLLASQKWLKDSGLEGQDLVGRSHYEVIPNIPDAWKATHQTCLTQGIEACIEDQLQRPDGTTIWIKCEICPWYNAKGAISGLILCREDITHQKRSVEALCNSQQLLKSIIDNTNAYIFVKEYLHTNGRYLLANQQFFNVFKVDSETIQNKTDYEIFPPEIAKAFRDSDRQVFETGTSIQVEETAPHADGLHTSVVIKFPLFNQAGIPYAVCGIATDISDRKQAELKLQQSKETLEIQVKNRTIELENMVEHLREEIIERQCALKERLAIEEKLRNSEVELRALFSAMTDVVIVLDAQGRYLKIAPTTPSLLYEPHQTLIGKTLHEVIPQDQADQILGYIHQALVSKQAIRFEYSRSLDDQTFWFEGSISALLGGEVIWIGRDITERKRVEESLREQVQLSSLRADVDCSLTKNNSLQEMLQHCAEHVVSRLDAAFARIWLLNPDENVLELQASAGMYTHLDGAHARIPVGQFKIGLIAEERQPHLTNSVLDDARVSDKAWAKREGMVAFAGYPLMAEDQMLGVIALFDRKLLTERTIAALGLIAGELALGIKRKQAEAALQTSESQLRQKTQELEAMLCELKHTQTQLVQTEKMSSLGQLVAGVAHEINNPVNFIFGNVAYVRDHVQDLMKFLQLYQKHYPVPVAEIQIEAAVIDLDFVLDDLPKILSSMKMGADRIKNIVLALRTFSRMDESEVKAVNIHEGIDSTLMILQSRLKASSSHPEIKVIKEYGDLPLVECYAGQLNQVFMNILANAIDALEEDFDDSGLTQAPTPKSQISPTIRIRTETVENQFVQIRISDNGAGIPEPVRQRLFEPFFTTKPIGKGTGLGLSISYQVVTEKHCGTLRCQSTPGQGTEFLIEIPRLQKPAP
jgi:two-component system, NtrC family, sensor kinase